MQLGSPACSILNVPKAFSETSKLYVSDKLSRHGCLATRDPFEA